MANQRDVAKRANVSSASVSRFLTNPQSVSPKVAQEISRAIEELNYRVDHSAQVLKTGKSRNIGILAPGAGTFHWDVFSGAQEELGRNGYYSTLLFTKGQKGKKHESEGIILPFIRSRHIDGALHLPTCTQEDDQTLSELMDWGKPFVVLDRHIAHARVPQVYIDNYKAGVQAAKEFLSLGHREFLFVWGIPEFASSIERFNGFREELRKHHIDVPLDRQIEGDFFSLNTYQETLRRWDHLPSFTAVFASNDSSALGFMKAAKERGKNCPDDFSIIGFDKNEEFSLLYQPALATFLQPAYQLGIRGAQMLLGLLEHKEPEQLKVPLEAKFIEGQSIRKIG